MPFRVECAPVIGPPSIRPAHMFPNCFMQWIANLFRRLRKPATDDQAANEEKPPVHTITRQGLRAAVFTGRRCCGHMGHLVEFQRWERHVDEWQPVALVFDDELQDAMDLLTDAKEWIVREEASPRGPR